MTQYLWLVSQPNHFRPDIFPLSLKLEMAVLKMLLLWAHHKVWGESKKPTSAETYRLWLLCYLLDSESVLVIYFSPQFI